LWGDGLTTRRSRGGDPSGGLLALGTAGSRRAGMASSAPVLLRRDARPGRLLARGPSGTRLAFLPGCGAASAGACWGSRPLRLGLWLPRLCPARQRHGCWKGGRLGRGTRWRWALPRQARRQSCAVWQASTANAAPCRLLPEVQTRSCSAGKAKDGPECLAVPVRGGSTTGRSSARGLGESQRQGRATRWRENARARVELASRHGSPQTVLFCVGSSRIFPFLLSGLLWEKFTRLKEYNPSK